MIAAVIATCSPIDQARLRPQRSCSKKISAFAAIGLERLSDNAHVADAGTLDRVHDGGESAEWDVFIGTQENRLMLRIANLLPQFVADLIDVHRIVSEEDALLLVNADHHALFGDLLHGSRLGNIDFNAR